MLQVHEETLRMISSLALTEGGRFFVAHIRCTCFDLIQTCSPAKMQRLRDLAHLFESLLERRRNDPSLEHFGEPEPLDSPCALDGIYAGLDQLFPPTLQ